MHCRRRRACRNGSTGPKELKGCLPVAARVAGPVGISVSDVRVDALLAFAPSAERRAPKLAPWTTITRLRATLPEHPIRHIQSCGSGRPAGMWSAAYRDRIRGESGASVDPKGSGQCIGSYSRQITLSQTNASRSVIELVTNLRGFDGRRNGPCHGKACGASQRPLS